MTLINAAITSCLPTLLSAPLKKLCVLMSRYRQQSDHNILLALSFLSAQTLRWGGLGLAPMSAPLFRHTFLFASLSLQIKTNRPGERVDRRPASLICFEGLLSQQSEDYCGYGRSLCRSQGQRSHARLLRNQSQEHRLCEYERCQVPQTKASV